MSGKAIGTDELVVRDTKFLDADENIDWEKWAPNGGRVPGTIKENQTIPAGTIIDRYGSQWGKYTSPAGVPYEQRALPYIENPNAYHKYEVLKPIDNVTISEIAPAFEQVGGGIQYELPNNIKKLKTSVYKGYKQDKIEMRGDRAEMSDFPLYLNMVAGGLDCRDQAIGGFSFVVKIYAVPVVEIIG